MYQNDKTIYQRRQENFRKFDRSGVHDRADLLWRQDVRWGKMIRRDIFEQAVP
jgi:hypothetical protein